MDDALILARAVHLASSALVSGGVMFVHVIAGPVFNRIDPQPLRVSFRPLLSAALAVSVISGVWWFFIVATQMTGRGVSEIFSDDTSWIVLGQTQFGLTFLLRGLCAAVLNWVVWSRRKAMTTQGSVASILTVAVAALYMGAIAWTGHAGASPGALGHVHVISDFLHLVAAAAWLGGLAPLAIALHLLSQNPDSTAAYRLTKRFSVFGMAVVAILLFSGVVNAWFLAGSIHALIETDYGRLLLVKIALFVAMVSVAAINRLIQVPKLSPILQGEGPSKTEAISRLQRNIVAELCLGITVVVIVAALGIMPLRLTPRRIFIDCTNVGY
jgi:putative copper resistance protein D